MSGVLLKRFASLIFLICVLISFKCQAFNWRKCEQAWLEKSTWLGEGAFISSTSFVSSTGECSMIGEVENDSKLYIVENKSKIFQEIAQGGGEYISAFYSFFECSSTDTKRIISSLKPNFEKLLRLQNDNWKVYDFLVDLTKGFNSCNYQSVDKIQTFVNKEILAVRSVYPLCTTSKSLLQ